MATEEAPAIQTELSRDLGLVTALSIGVGTMIAAGIFTLSGLAVSQVGSAAIVSFLLAATVASFTALSYCEFSSVYPESGEGYLYARKTFSPPIAYLVGWCLLLGYTSSCAFYLSSLSSYFNEFIWRAPTEHLAGFVILGSLTLLNIKGTKESGKFQVAVTGAKVLLLLWFVAGGLGKLDGAALWDRFATDLSRIASTGAMVFITFFGFSAIAASAGEVKQPTRTIPRAIFLSMGIVTILYSVVVLVMVAANLSEYTEAAMGIAARQFLGPVGALVIVGGAIFSMISASNASILAGSRVALSMSDLGHLPREIGTVNAVTRTPVVSLVLVGIAIGAFTTMLPLESLAHFADCILLVALVFVNAALMAHRRRYPGLVRPFRVPFGPVLPSLGIIANLYLLAQIPLHGHVTPVLLAVLGIVIGFLAFLAWKGTQPAVLALPGEPSRVALERSSHGESKQRILLPIANPASVLPFVDMACAIAARHQGELIVLCVVVVPDQLSPSEENAYVERERRILEIARERALERDVPVTALVRIGHNAARAILETSRERDCDLIILGWKGYTSTARRVLGEVTDDVVSHAQTDIMLVRRMDDDRPIERILVPTAGGENATRAAQYAADIVHAAGGALTLCSVVPPEAPPERVRTEDQRLRKAAESLSKDATLAFKVVRHGSVSAGIIKEGTDYDAIALGAAGQRISSQILFGSVPESIARFSKRTVIVVKRHEGVKTLVRRVLTE